MVMKLLSVKINYPFTMSGMNSDGTFTHLSERSTKKWKHKFSAEILHYEIQ